MQTRTWNLNLTATDELPEIKVDGISRDDTVAIVRELMYGSLAAVHAHVENVARAADERVAIAA